MVIDVVRAICDCVSAFVYIAFSNSVARCDREKEKDSGGTRIITFFMMLRLVNVSVNAMKAVYRNNI